MTIQNVIAHGAGTSAINGHPDSWLEGVRLQNVRLFVSHDPEAPYESTASAMVIKQARDFTMKDVEIHWQPPDSTTWQTGLVAEQVKDLSLDGVRIDTAPGSTHPVVVVKDSDGVTLRHSQAATLLISGHKTRSVRLVQSDSKVTTDPDVPKTAIVRQ